MQAQVDEKDRQLQELRELNAELEDEIEVLAEGAGGGGGARVAQLEDELERLEQALEGRGGGAGEVGRLRREKRALQEERDELEEQVEELQAGAAQDVRQRTLQRVSHLYSHASRWNPELRDGKSLKFILGLMRHFTLALDTVCTVH